MSSKKFIFRFFLTYFCVLIPFLAFSITASHQSISGMKRQELQIIDNHLYQLTLTLNQLERTYEDMSYTLSLHEDLQFSRIQDGNSEYRGCTILKDVAYYDPELETAFAYYGDDRIYASTGSSNYNFYFNGVLKCTEESARAGLELLRQKSDGHCLLWTGATSGFLYLHYYRSQMINNNQNEISMNFCIPFTKVAKMLDQLATTDSHTYIELKMENENAIHFYTESEVVNVRTIPENALPAEDELNRYTSLSRQAEVLGMSCTVSYRSDLLYQDINRMQLLVYFAIAIGILLSSILSFYLGAARWKNLHKLEMIIPNKLKLPSNNSDNEYTYLGSALEKLVSESNELERNSLSYRNTLKQQSAMLLFNGLLKDRKAAEPLLNECGITLNEEYYFVVGILEEGTVSVLSRFEASLSGDLYSEITIDGHHAIIFFAELPNIDRAKKIRLEVANRLSFLLQEMGAKGVKIAISQVYQQLSMSNYAYKEAVGILEQMLHKGFTQSVECCENVIKADERVLALDQHDLQRFSDALDSFDEATALQYLSRMNQYIVQNSGSEENKRYLRYCILHPLVIATKLTEKSKAYEEALHIDTSDGNKFEHAVGKILHAYCGHLDAKDDFARIVQYVEEHYAQSDLSYESVAAYAGFTKTYLSRLFRAKTGMSYIEYLTQIRMEKANELIRTTNLPIKEIILRVGYLDDSSFRRKFKAFYGINVYDVRHKKPNDQEAAASS